MLLIPRHANMKIAMAAVLIVVFGLAFQICSLNKSVARVAARVDAVEDDMRVNGEALKATDMAAKCAAQADKTFLALGYKRDGSDPKRKPGGTTLQNHYNDELHKCFMLIVQADYGTDYYEQRLLLDAFESRQYGDYFFTNLKNGGTSIVCTLTPLTGPETHCNTEDEFKVFIAEYMR